VHQLLPSVRVTEGRNRPGGGISEFFGCAFGKDEARFALLHRVGQAAGLADHRHCAVAHGKHLAEAAGLEGAGHQEDIAPAVDSLGKGHVKRFHKSHAAGILGF
jgi:hypothetical protein